MQLIEPAFTAQQRGFLDRWRAAHGRRYVFGCTREAASVIATLPVDYVVDSWSQAPAFEGRPIVRLDAVPQDALVIAAVMFRPLEVRGLLDARGLDHLDYYALLALHDLPLQPVDYWEGAAGHFAANRAAYTALHDALADDVSRDTLVKVVSFREGGDLRAMEGFTRTLDMYFEPFLGLPPQPLFFDVGSFDGSDAFRFARLYPDYAHVVLFEPEPANVAAIRRALPEGLRHTLVEAGVSSREGEAVIVGRGSASSLDGSGLARSGAEPESRVPLVRIDDVAARLGLTPDLIKMDIEGHEPEALRGAQATLARRRPAVAASVYHAVPHILEIWDILRAVHPGYRFYMRHYSEGFAETVLFAVP